MTNNLFQDFQDKKNSLINLAKKSVEFGWIPQKKEKNNPNGVISLEEIEEKLRNDKLTIGVIGQMKCGKSTFLNSFVFEDNILPSATTPMTAALSVITYGETEKIVAEFYSQEEWEEQKAQAERNEDDAPYDKSKIMAARELVSKSKSLGSELKNFLGKTKDDSFSNLIEYVGADGKFVSITKSVTIYYPKEYLKGVEIVDTPGFNDPIVSREERTKEFLKRADVVIMMLYAGRPFDATDRDIIFKNVSQCGTGKVLIGINKYDIPYCNGEDEGQIKDYVIEELRKACKESDDDTLVRILKETTPIPLSAEMALLSKLQMSKINSDESMNFSWKNHCSNFGIGSQTEMYKWSHQGYLVDAIKEIIEKEKFKILLEKPINAIVAAGAKKLLETEQTFSKEKRNLEILNTPDNELEEKTEKLNKAEKRINKKIENFSDDIDSDLKKIEKEGAKTLEDTVRKACCNMKSIIDNEWGRFKSFESVRPQLNSILNNLVQRELKYECEAISNNGENKIKRLVKDFINEVEEQLEKYIEDFDSKDFIKSVYNKISLELEEGDLFKLDLDNDDDSGLGDFILEFINGATWGLLGAIGNALTHTDEVARIKDHINELENGFEPGEYIEKAFNSKEKIKEEIKTIFIDELIKPLQKQIKDAINQKDKKEENIKKSEENIKKLETDKKNISEQINEINKLKSALA